MTKTISLAEYQRLERDYQEAYEAGRTAQPCTFCDQLVTEKEANWDFYDGQGVILHQHCVVHWYQSDVALDWWMLGFGLITGTWYKGIDGDSDHYMHMFAASLGYGRFA